MTVQINLLPWREQRIEQQKKQFIAISAAVTLFALLLLLLLWSYQTYKLDDQVQANQLISSSQQELERQLKQAERQNAQDQTLLKQMQLLHALQGQRPITARLIDELARLLPTDLYVDKISRSANSLTLEGRAAHPNTVATLLHKLEASVWFQHALMRSFVMRDSAQLTPQAFNPPEDSFGHYVVSVDLGNIAIEPPKAPSP